MKSFRNEEFMLIIIGAVLLCTSVCTEADAFEISVNRIQSKTPEVNVRHIRDADRTLKGEYCHGPCEKRGESYYWCVINTGRLPVFVREWDYCKPNPLIALEGTTCGNGRKCVQIIRYGPSVTWCCDNNLDCEKCVTKEKKDV